MAEGSRDATDLYQYLTDGQAFSKFVDDILRSQIETLGLRYSIIRTCLKPVSDGGVDTEIMEPLVGDPTKWASDSPTIWQYKARRYGDVTDADLNREIDKHYVKELTEKGYAYRLCICDEIPAVWKKNKEELLEELIRKVNPKAPQPKILSAADLASWANRFSSGSGAASLPEYRKRLKEHCQSVSILGFGTNSKPIRLSGIFVKLFARGWQEPVPRQEQDGEGYELRGIPPVPVLNLLKNEKRLILLGEPGQGKTTVMRQYVFEFLKNSTDNRLPILVELDRVPDWQQENDEKDWIRRRSPIPVQDKLWGELQTLMKEGKVILLLDGLDELNHNAVQKVIAQVPNLPRNNQIVLSSRPHAYRQNPLGNFKEYQIQELGWPQVYHLSENLCKSLKEYYHDIEPEKAVEKVIFAANRGGSMAKNPLFLSFLCFAAMSGRELSSCTSRLIDNHLTLLTEWHRNRKQGSHKWPKTLDAGRVKKILGQLALASIKDKERKGTIPEGEIAKLHETDRENLEFLRDARLVDRIWDADNKYPWRFTLETFREFFAACAIAEDKNPFEVVKPHLSDRDWMQIIAYTAGLLEEDTARSFIAEILNAKGPYEEILHHNLLVAAACLAGLEVDAESGNLPEQVVKKHMDFQIQTRGNLLPRIGSSLSGLAKFQVVLEQLLKFSDDKHTLVREAAVQALSGAASLPEVQEKLFKLMEGEDPWVQGLSAQVLSGAASLAEVQERLFGLMKDGNPQAQGLAARALSGAAQLPDVRGRLLKLAKDENPSVRSAGLLTLLHAAARFPKVQKPVLSIFRKMRGSKAFAAGFLSTAVLLPEVKEEVQMWILEDAEDWDYIPSFPVKEVFSGDLGPRVQEKLFKLIKVENPPVQVFAAMVLSSTTPLPDVQKGLLELVGDENPWVQELSAEALSGAALLPEVQEKLFKLMEGEDPGVREAAVQALSGAAQLPDVRVRLLKLAKDENPSVQLTVAESVPGAMSDNEYQNLLLNLVKCEDPNLQAIATEALSRFASVPKVQEVLLKIAEDNDQLVSDDALLALSRAGVSATEKVLKRLARLAITSSQAWETLENLVAAKEKGKSRKNFAAEHPERSHP